MKYNTIIDYLFWFLGRKPLESFLCCCRVANRNCKSLPPLWASLVQITNTPVSGLYSGNNMISDNSVPASLICLGLFKVYSFITQCPVVGQDRAKRRYTGTKLRDGRTGLTVLAVRCVVCAGRKLEVLTTLR